VIVLLLRLLHAQHTDWVSTAAAQQHTTCSFLLPQIQWASRGSWPHKHGSSLPPPNCSHRVLQGGCISVKNITVPTRLCVHTHMLVGVQHNKSDEGCNSFAAASASADALVPPSGHQNSWATGGKDPSCAICLADQCAITRAVLKVHAGVGLHCIVYYPCVTVCTNTYFGITLR
jgi:hypothetical protein